MTLTRLIRRYRRQEKGSLSVEAVLIFPILLWAYAATFVFWDAFSTRNSVVDATYTLADLVSRQTASLDPDFVEGMSDLFEVLVRNGTGGDMRVTVVDMVKNPDPFATEEELLVLNWSYATGSFQAYDKVDPLVDRMPIMAIGASMIVVETRSLWTPPMNIGMSEQNLEGFVFVSPRFVPQIVFTGV